MKNFKSIEKKIDDISALASRDERKQLNNLKKMILSYNDKLFYEANYDKRLCIANYNKFLVDVSELDKNNFYFLFIRIPNLALNFHLDEQEKDNGLRFLNCVKESLSTLENSRKSVYVVCEDYFAIIADKNSVNKIYNEIKKIKESKSYWKKYQMTYIKYTKYSSKITKNVSACIKQAYHIFGGKQQNEDMWG